MPPHPRASIRTVLAVVLGAIVVLVVGLLTLLRPGILLSMAAGAAGALLIVAFVGYWQRHSIHGRLLAVALAASLVLGFALSFFGPVLYYVTPQVTVPYALTGRLLSGTWQIRDEIRIDSLAFERLRSQMRDEAVLELPQSLVIPGWRLDRTVDMAPVFVRHRTLPVSVGSVGLAHVHVNLPAPRVTSPRWPDDERDIVLVPRAGSTAVLVAPRAAVAATTPSAERSAAIVGGDIQTTVALDDSTRELTIAVVGGWLRSPLGIRLYDLSSWSPLPYLAGLASAAAVGMLRHRIPELRRRLRLRRRSSGERDQAARRVPVTAAPRLRGPQRMRVAGARRRRP
jgi:hypothetical protein